MFCGERHEPQEVKMNIRIKLAVGMVALVFGCASLRAQWSFNGQIKPGVSTRSDVEKALGAPIKQESDTLFDYKPQAGASGLQIAYRADGTVSYLSATFAQAYARV